MYLFSHAGSGWSAAESTDFNFVSVVNKSVIVYRRVLKHHLKCSIEKPNRFVFIVIV